MNKHRKIILFLLAPIMALAVALPVVADSNGSGNDSQQSEAAKHQAEVDAENAKKAAEDQAQAAKEQVEAKREAAKQAAEKQREADKNAIEQAKELLSGDRLKACEDNETEIDDTMTAIDSRGQLKINLFSQIADRTETFYVKKGNVLADYNALVAAVNSKKVAAQAAVDAAITSSVGFKCDGNNPKGVADDFKGKIGAMNDALKEYRTAVKNLIVGVKSVQSTTKPEAQG